MQLEHVHFVGEPGRGEFLEGLNLREKGYVEWTDSIRNNPRQIYSLYGASFQPITKAILPSISILPFKIIMGSPDHQVLGD